MKKLVIYISTLVIVCLLSCSNIEVNAAYNYTPDMDEIASAESLVAMKSIDSSNLVDKTGNLISSEYSFGSLYDIADDEENIYVCDGSNNVVVVLDHNYNYITRFPNSDTTLKNPQGLYVTKDFIYVCDYGNNRVAIFNKNFELVQEVLTPTDKVFEKYEFRPKKITVSRTGRMYVVAEGVNEGILDFNKDGTFSRFYGMNQATLSAWDAFWQLFTSEEQKKSQGYNFGASLLNLCIDEDEYVYTVSSPNVGTNFIKRLNYKASDVLNRNGYVPNDGDVVNETLTPGSRVPEGSSTFVDIDVNSDGTYIALDKTRGRIFAYDFEGNLLYEAGSLGTAVDGVSSNQNKLFQLPEALCYYKDKILTVDSKNKNLIIFEFTDFGKLVNEATHLYKNNEYEEAAKIWEQVLELNSNYLLAYAGIGKAQFRQGNYEDALKNLKLGNDLYNYSQAYKQYRYEKLSVVAPYILSVVLITCIALLVRSFIKNANTAEKEGEI